MSWAAKDRATILQNKNSSLYYDFGTAILEIIASDMQFTDKPALK